MYEVTIEDEKSEGLFVLMAEGNDDLIATLLYCANLYTAHEFTDAVVEKVRIEEGIGDSREKPAMVQLEMDSLIPPEQAEEIVIHNNHVSYTIRILEKDNILDKTGPRGLVTERVGIAQLVGGLLFVVKALSAGQSFEQLYHNIMGTKLEDTGLNA